MNPSKIVDASPQHLLALMVNALGCFHRINRYSKRMQKTLAEWRSLEHLDQEDVRKYQVQRLRHVLAAAATTPFYSRLFRQVGLDPDKVTSLKDLQLLPVLGRGDLAKYGDQMIVPSFNGRRVRKTSSGTTGEPVRYMQPSPMAYEQTYAMLYQFYGWHGVKPLARRATLAGRYMGRKPEGVVIRNWPENQLLLGVHSLSAGSVVRYLDALNRFNPVLLQAHPSALLLLKGLAEEANLPAPGVSLINYTAESLTSHERSVLSEWLGGARIFGTYGSGENVMAAGECLAMNGYHIHPAVGICELIENQGELEIVGTSLLNDAMPLIRYRVGDLALSVDNAPCPCGCTWPRLIGIQGRVDDLIYAPDGRPIASVVLRTGIASLNALRSPYSIIQHKEQGVYSLRIYSALGADPADGITAVMSYLRSVFGETSVVRVHHAPREEMLTVRAKHRIVIKE